MTQEEAAKCAKAVPQAQQHWVNWEGVERMNITCSERWSLESNRLSFIIKAIYDVLPSPSNLHLWFDEDPACLQCAAPPNLKQVLVGCQTCLTQGRYSWHHNQVFNCLAAKLENKRVTTNTMPVDAEFLCFTASLSLSFSAERNKTEAARQRSAAHSMGVNGREGSCGPRCLLIGWPRA